MSVIGPSSLRDKAYQSLHDMILTGKLSPGAVVSETSLAKEMGISRTPVREAVQQLEREGLLEQVPRFGTIVRRLERRDIIELFELREALECFAVRRAAERITAQELATAQRLCDEVKQIGLRIEKSGEPAANAVMMQRFLAADMGFHTLLIRAAGNSRIMKAVAESRVLARIFGARRQAHDAAVMAATHAEHLAILTAIQQRDGDSAAAAMSRHISNSRQAAMSHYDQSAGAQAMGPLDLPSDVMAELERIASAS